jgi:hypothetical protein
MSSRHMRLSSWTALRSDSEHLHLLAFRKLRFQIFQELAPS